MTDLSSDESLDVVPFSFRIDGERERVRAELRYDERGGRWVADGDAPRPGGPDVVY